MARTLLMGNGPNRLSSAAVSWTDVMRQIAAEKSLDANIVSEDKPLPLLFEELALAWDRRGADGLADLKRKFAQSIDELVPNEVHRAVMSRGFAHVLTTNYDYSLELAKDGTMPERGDSEPLVRETKYSIFRHRIAGPTRVWHIHGEASQPNTLQLGYEHYGSGLSRIEQYLRASVRGHRSWFAADESVPDEDTPPRSWVDIFLRDDIHIMGLACDFVEVDLWWLLVYKERLRCKRRKSVGRTFYHASKISDLKPAAARVHGMLRGVGVQIVHSSGVDLDDYRGSYLSTIDSIGSGL